MSLQTSIFNKMLFYCVLFAVVAGTSAFPQNVGEPSKFERIITEFDDVLKGVPIDYSYNESSRNAGEHTSVPGCPKSEEGYPWVYYGSPEGSRCFLAGEKGPCELGQKIFVEKDNPYGYCNCDCFEAMPNARNEKLVRAQFCDNGPSGEVAFLPNVKKCYKLYSQGPCKDNQWLVKVNDSETTPTSVGTASLVKCETRRCPEGQLPWTYYDTDGNSTEECSAPFAAYGFPAAILPKYCENSGMKYSRLLKKCIKNFDFNIG